MQKGEKLPKKHSKFTVKPTTGLIFSFDFLLSISTFLTNRPKIVIIDLKQLGGDLNGNCK
jgi:hypothetical protein